MVYPKLYTRNFILLSSANLLMATGFYFLMPTLPMFIVDVLKGSTGQVGYIISVYTLSALFIRLFTGFFIDSFGRKWIYLVAFAAFALLLGVYVLVYSYLWLLILRFLHGFTWGVSTTSASTIVVDMVPAKRRGEAIGIYGLSFTMAMAVGPLIALAILGSGNYKGMFLSALGLALSGFLLVMLVQFPKYIRPANIRKLTFSNIIAPATLPMAFIQLLFGITYGGILSFITLYAREKSMGEPGAFFSVFAIGIAVSRIISGKVFDLHGPGVLVTVGLLSGAAGFLVLGLNGNFHGFILAAILVGVCMGVTMPTLQAMANNVVDHTKRGAANATFITAFDIGIGGGSLLLGFVAQWTSLATMYVLSAAIVLVALIIFQLFTRLFYEQHKITEGFATSVPEQMEIQRPE